MVVWGVVSSEIEQVIEFFGSLEEAERVLAVIVRDEPESGWTISASSASSSAPSR
jgi:hypothetical protein